MMPRMTAPGIPTATRAIMRIMSPNLASETEGGDEAGSGAGDDISGLISEVRWCWAPLPTL